MSLRKLLEQITKDLYEYTQEELMGILEEHGIALEDRQLDYYIGSGGYGDVYKVKGKNKVIKFTTNDTEFEKIDYIMGVQDRNNPKHVVKYYFNRKINDRLFFSVMEYLEKNDMRLHTGIRKTLKLLEKSVYEVLKNSPEDIGDDIMRMMIDDFITHMEKNRHAPFADTQGMKEAFKDILKNYDDIDVQILFKWIWNVISILKRDELLMFIYEIDQKSDFFKDVISGIKELKEMDVWHGDTHHNNILKDPKSGKYKLIDPI